MAANYIKKPFTEKSFKTLFDSESERSREILLSDPLVTPNELSTRFLYVDSSDFDRGFSTDNEFIDIPESLIYQSGCIRSRLFANGKHREWINLSPIGVSKDFLYFEVAYSDQWTDHVFVGGISFPGEPFKLSGPSLPCNWKTGEPLPPVVLPFVNIF